MVRAGRFAALLLFLLASALGESQTGADAKDANGCEGLESYRKAMLAAGQDFINALENDGIPVGRDPLTFSSAEWRTFAERAAAFQAALKEIAPPSFAAEWHQAQVERYGLLEQAAKAIADNGVMASAAFSEAIDKNEAARADALTAATAACSDFASFNREYDALDGQIDGTPEASRRPEAVAFGKTAVVADMLSVEVLKVFRDPKKIDPTANWFIDWLNENPRPEGSEFFTIRLRVTNVGREPVTDFDFTVGFAADSGADYGSGESCGNVPGGMSFGNTLQPGDSVDANFCRVVRLRDVDTLVAYVEPAFSYDEQDRVYFELQKPE